MKYAITGLALLVLLTGCKTAISEKAVKLTVPDVVQYPKEVQIKAAEELRGGLCPTLNEFIVDYGVMRDQARVAAGQKVNIKR